MTSSIDRIHRRERAVSISHSRPVSPLRSKAKDLHRLDSLTGDWDQIIRIKTTMSIIYLTYLNYA